MVSLVPDIQVVLVFKDALIFLIMTKMHMNSMEMVQYVIPLKQWRNILSKAIMMSVELSENRQAVMFSIVIPMPM